MRDQIWLIFKAVRAEGCVERLIYDAEIASRGYEVDLRYRIGRPSDAFGSRNQGRPIQHIEVANIWATQSGSEERANFQDRTVSESELRDRVSNRISGADAPLPLSMPLEVPYELLVCHSDEIWMPLSVEGDVQRDRLHDCKPGLF